MAEDEPQDAAAEAFEALGAEVAQLRLALEGLPTTAPDYSPTLAAIAQSLAAMEAHPALRLTPDALASQVRQASEAAQQQGRRELANAVQRVDAAGADLERLAERQRTGREQVRQVAIMTAVGAVAGVIVWVCFSGPIARAAGELGRAGTDGRRDVAAGSLGGRRAAHAERQPAGLGSTGGCVGFGPPEPRQACDLSKSCVDDWPGPKLRNPSKCRHVRQVRLLSGGLSARVYILVRKPSVSCRGSRASQFSAREGVRHGVV